MKAPSALEQLLGRRRMVRAFEPTPLPADVINRLLDLARRAPSAGHTQATGFVVLDHPETVARYWAVTLPEHRRASFRWKTLLRAPVLVLVTTEPERYPDRYREPDKIATGRGDGLDHWPVPYWWVDAGAVVQNLLLLVTEAGLGACLFGPFDHEAELARTFELGEGVRIVATIAIGHRAPDEPGRSTGRGWKPLNELLRRPTELSSDPSRPDPTST